MRAFTMNLQNYNANTQNPVGGAPTAKQTALRNEMNAYSGAIGGQPVNVAGFVEVGVADMALQANVVNALDDFGTALNIPAGAGGRQFAVIRCGRTALVASNEVVAIVLDGNAVVATYGLLWFDNPVGLVWQNQPVAAAGGYTSQLAIPAHALPDYRYIVYVTFTLAGAPYTVGFIHNRAPGHDETVVVMGGIRALLENGAPVNLTMCGGPGQPYPAGGHHVHWYYSPGNTTAVNPLDYFISFPRLFAPGGAATASSDTTPNAPNGVAGTSGYTGSDHRGVGIAIA